MPISTPIAINAFAQSGTAKVRKPPAPAPPKYPNKLRYAKGVYINQVAPIDTALRMTEATKTITVKNIETMLERKITANKFARQIKNIMSQ